MRRVRTSVCRVWYLKTPSFRTFKFWSTSSVRKWLMQSFVCRWGYRQGHCQLKNCSNSILRLSWLQILVYLLSTSRRVPGLFLKIIVSRFTVRDQTWTANALVFGWFVSQRRFVACVEVKEDVGWEVVDWIILARDRDRCRAVVNTVMNFLTK